MIESSKLIFFAILIIAVILEVLADILFKKWSMNSKTMLLILGALLYLTATIFWAFSLKYETLSKAGSVFMILNVILIVLSGILIFKEDLSLINKIGVSLGIVSIILIEI